MAHTLLYGGTFDPVHLGHLQTTAAACELLDADRVLLIPARTSPHKTDQQSASAAHRVAMLRLAIEGKPEFAIDTRELDRPPPSYTIDTLTALRGDYPKEQFTLLIGADQLPKLHTWHRVQELLASTKIAILGRDDKSSLVLGLKAIDHLGDQTAEVLIRSVLETPLVPISSTDIRGRVAAGQPIDDLVPPKVAAYIREHHLYRL